MQRKGKVKYNIRDKLHSIPIKMNVKSNVLYSIPKVLVIALLLGLMNLLFTHKSYAYYTICDDGSECSSGSSSDLGTISPITGTGTSTPPTASISLSKPNMVSDIATPGNTATVSTDVTVNVSNADSYSLTLKVGSTSIKSGNTTLAAGNVTTDNTWGYKWDNASTYTAPTTSGTSLTVPALSNNATSFTKTLTFGAKFASTADAGHYKASGTLSLVATPREVVITLADLTEMQQLSLTEAADACENTPYADGQKYSAEYTLKDVRDNKTYKVQKLQDGKCWMVSNLALTTAGSTMNYTGGRQLKSTTTDITSDWTLPTTTINLSSTNFSSSDYYKAESYVATPSSDAGETGYYSFTAATAGWATESVTSGDSPQSICPKGWKLPTNSEFKTLYDQGGIFGGNTNPWYYTGRVYNGSLNDSSIGYWRSSTVYYQYTWAYILSLNSNGVSPDNAYERYRGFPIRCVAR